MGETSKQTDESEKARRARMCESHEGSKIEPIGETGGDKKRRGAESI